MANLFFGILEVYPQEQHVWMCISLDFPALSCIHLSFQNCIQGKSLAVQRLGLHGLTAKSLGLIPGQGAKILQAKQHSQGQGENNCIQSTVFLFFFPLIFISWRLITWQYCSGFCHTLTRISHGVTCISHPDPPSHLPLHPILLGLPSAPGPSTTWAGDLFHYR